jgi:hypothetical protein
LEKIVSSIYLIASKETFSVMTKTKVVKPHIFTEMFYGDKVILGLRYKDEAALKAALTLIFLTYDNVKTFENEIKDYTPRIFKDYYPRNIPPALEKKLKK